MISEKDYTQHYTILIRIQSKRYNQWLSKSLQILYVFYKSRTYFNQWSTIYLMWKYDSIVRYYTMSWYVFVSRISDHNIIFVYLGCPRSIVIIFTPLISLIWYNGVFRHHSNLTPVALSLKQQPKAWLFSPLRRHSSTIKNIEK